MKKEVKKKVGKESREKEVEEAIIVDEKEANKAITIDEKEALKKQNKQTKWVFIVMALILVSVFLIPYIIGKSREFNYAGLEFKKILFDKLPLYHARIPLASITGDVVSNYNLYLRNDPRELEYIPIKGEIKLLKDVVLTFNPEMVCKNEIIASTSVVGFIRGASSANLIPGTLNKSGVTSKLAYANCDSHNQTTLIFDLGNKTEIIRERTNCYRIYVANCEIVEAAERLIIGMAAHANGYLNDEKF